MESRQANQILSTLHALRKEFELLRSGITSEEGTFSFSNLKLLDTLITAVDELRHSVKDITLPHRLEEIKQNLQYYVIRLKLHVDQQNKQLFLYDFKYHLSSLFKIFEYEIAYLVEAFVDKKEYPQLYPDLSTIDHKEIVEKGKDAEYKVSIVLLAYNNLDYTRQCVESILQYTDDVEYELILVNNGSTDGTLAYFESIPGAKVIHLEYNIHLVKGFNIGLMAAEGKYSAAVCNDFIFTSNWLSNLMICIESDSDIGFVSPGATYISNYQQISIPFTSKDEFQELAKNYNISDPYKWQERIVLLPNVLCCPTALLEKIGYYDTRYYRGEFLDDDISFRIRRAGYKLIFCGDTVTHHYGSITTTSDHATNSLAEGRNTFTRRYGLDAWNDARFDQKYFYIEHSAILNKKNVLGIDVKCGATVLQIKNKMWTINKEMPKLSIYTSQSKYVQDCISISQHVSEFHHFSDIPYDITNLFDFVYIERPLNEYAEDLHSLFATLSKIMLPGGTVIFAVNNVLSSNYLHDLVNEDSSIHNSKIYLWNDIILDAQTNGFQVFKVTPVADHSTVGQIQIVDQLLKLLSTNDAVTRKNIKDKLSSSYGVFHMTFKQ